MRLLPFAAADGATNMAADEAMLESAAEAGLVSIRFYTWSEPTLSLGYFQPGAGRERPGLSSLAWVRRSTGGAGIVHHHELTYSFALPGERHWRSAEPWICRVHKMLQAVLHDRGVTSRLVACGEEQKLGEVLCFLHHTAGDLVIDGSKIAGSAQRKLHGAMLQHGSLLMRQSEFAPELPGMCDLAKRDLFTLRRTGFQPVVNRQAGSLSYGELFTPEDLAKMLTAKFAADTGARIEADEWTAKELARVPRIREEKYANPEWNGRR